jgi:ribonuclease P protein component
VKKQFRLTRTMDIKRVRRIGKSYAHPLIVLYISNSEEEKTRVGVVAGRWVGGAVKRNRSRRLIKECMRWIYPHLLPGNADLSQTKNAISNLLQRANLISSSHDNIILLS